MKDLTQRSIEFDEGRRSVVYLDERGIPSIGVGHNLKANPPCAAALAIQAKLGLPAENNWTDDTIDAQYQDDLNSNCSWLWTRPWWANLDEVRRAALNNMAFNLGPARDAKFTTFFGYVSVYDWEAAANDLHNTAVDNESKGLHIRYERLCGMIRTGVFPASIP